MKDAYLVKTTNKFNFVDYQTPINPIKNDMRTSYHFGHQNYLLNDLINPPTDAIDACQVLGQKEARYDYLTETRRQFRWKTPVEHVAKANIAMSCKKLQFIQREQERTFQRPPNTIRTGTTTDRTYPTPPRESFCEKFIPIGMKYRSPPASQDLVYCNQPGHAKYMDLFATTTMLDYPPRTIDQQNGIGRKDYITLYDWFELPKSKGFGLHFYPVKQRGFNEPIGDRMKFPLLVKDRIIPNTKDNVPHNGMRSEQRAEYGVPVEMEFETDVYDIAPLAIPPTGLKTGRTEYQMYGSGQRIDGIILQN